MPDSGLPAGWSVAPKDTGGLPDGWSVDKPDSGGLPDGWSVAAKPMSPFQQQAQNRIEGSMGAEKEGRTTASPFMQGFNQGPIGSRVNSALSAVAEHLPKPEPFGAEPSALPLANAALGAVVSPYTATYGYAGEQAGQGAARLAGASPGAVQTAGQLGEGLASNAALVGLGGVGEAEKPSTQTHYDWDLDKATIPKPLAEHYPAEPDLAPNRFLTSQSAPVQSRFKASYDEAPPIDVPQKPQEAPSGFFNQPTPAAEDVGTIEPPAPGKQSPRSIDVQKAQLTQALIQKAESDPRMTPEMLSKFKEEKSVPAVPNNTVAEPDEAAQGEPAGQAPAPGAGGEAAGGPAPTGAPAGLDAQGGLEAGPRPEPQPGLGSGKNSVGTTFSDVSKLPEGWKPAEKASRKPTLYRMTLDTLSQDDVQSMIDQGEKLPNWIYTKYPDLKVPSEPPAGAKPPDLDMAAARDRWDARTPFGEKYGVEAPGLKIERIGGESKGPELTYDDALAGKNRVRPFMSGGYHGLNQTMEAAPESAQALRKYANADALAKYDELKGQPANPNAVSEARNAAMQQLEKDGLVRKVKKGEDAKTFDFEDRTFKAVKRGNYVMPEWFDKEARPLLDPDQAGELGPPTLGAKLGRQVTRIQTGLGVDKYFHYTNEIGQLMTQPGVGESAFGRAMSRVPVANRFNAMRELFRGIKPEDAPMVRDMIQNGEWTPRFAQEDALTRKVGLNIGEKTGDLSGMSQRDLAGRIAYRKAILRDDPTLTPNELYEAASHFGEYNNKLAPNLVRKLKTSEVGQVASPFVTAGNAMNRNAIASLTKLGTTGIGGALGSWVVAHKAVTGLTAYKASTGHFPAPDEIPAAIGMGHLPDMKDPNAKLLQIPYGDPLPDGSRKYINWGNIAAPMVARGLGVTGITAFANALVHGATPGQAGQELISEATNRQLHPFTGPAVKVLTRLFGAEPEFKMSGGNVALWPAHEPTEPGPETWQANIRSASEALNPTLEKAAPYIEKSAGLAHKGVKEEPLNPVEKAAKIMGFVSTSNPDVQQHHFASETKDILKQKRSYARYNQ